MTRAGLFLISWLPWPRCEAPRSLSLGPLSANEEKLGRGLVLSCLIFITGTGFHARTIFITRVRSSQEVTSREAHCYYYPHKKVMMNKNSAEIKISLNIWSSEMYKGLAIYIGAWWAWAARGGGAGERGLGRGAGSKHDLGLARAHPSSRGGGGRVRPQCCIQHTLHLAHSIIIKILISNIKTGWISSVSLPHETCRDLPCLTSGPGPPSTLRVRDQGHEASGPGEIEKLGICV